MREHRLLVTVEDGAVVNGFGAHLAAVVQTTGPEVRVVPLGVPDRTYEHAPRAHQLAELDERAFKQRLGQFLARRGFDWDTIAAVVERLRSERSA